MSSWSPQSKIKKFVVAVIKNNKVIGCLPLGKTGRFTKTIFYLLRDDYPDCKVKIVDSKVFNLGDGKRMRVSYILLFRGQSEFIDTLSNELSKKM